MHGQVYSRSQHQGPRVEAGRTPPPSRLRDWHGPTLEEFIRQVEHGFGHSVDLSALHHAGLAQNESLDPSDIRELCELLGLPAEDFGVSQAEAG